MGRHGNFIIFTLFIVISVISCKESEVKATPDPVLQKIGGDYYQDLIRTPVNPDGSIDTANMAKIKFDQSIHDFGTLNEGEVRNHKFTFENTGTIDLILIDVKSSCGCTIPSFSEKPIKPGETGEIKIKYDSKNKEGIQEKKIIVRSNTFPNQQELTIIAEVIKK